MTWILDEAEVTLRADGYSTARLPDVAAFAFENETTFGFLIEFPTTSELVQGWQSQQTSLLERFASALRTSGPKAWNVYTVVLTADETKDSDSVFAVETIEENLQYTRKIPRQAVRTRADVRVALSPLLSIAAQTNLAAESFEDRLARRLESEIGASAAGLFLSDADVETAARGLTEAEK